MKLSEFYSILWKKRRHYSEVSGKWLGYTPLSAYFHHILPKRHYKNAIFDPENIILLTIDEHANVESDMYRYEEINKKRIKLLKKYEEI